MPHRTADSPAYIWKGAPKTLQDRSLPAPRPQPCSPGSITHSQPAWVPCHHAALNESHGLRPGGWLQTQAGVQPCPRTCLSVTAPGARRRARSTTRARLMFSTSGPSHVPLPRGEQPPCLLASLGPAHPEHARHLLRKGSLGPPITLFSLKSPASSLLQPFLQGNCLLNVSL